MAVGVPVAPTPAIVSIPTTPVPGTVAADLVKIQDRLHDTGTIWSQAELLRSYNEAYRRLLTHSKAVKMHYCFDVPPRNAYTYCYEWEDSAVSGPSWMCMLGVRAGTYRATTRWEAQQAENIAITTGEGTGITQQWERSIIGTDADRNYDLVFPKDERNPSRVRFNNTIMLPITTLELDQVHIHWPSFVGQPYWWTAGFGRVKTIEIYRIQTDYTQAYQLIYPVGLEQLGLPRNWSGVRTYSVDYTGVYAANTVGYSSSGDGQVLASFSMGFAWRFTFYQATDTAKSFCTQAWEADTLNAASIIRTGGTVGTYRWEYQLGADQVEFAIGAVRRMESQDRQYFPVMRGTGVVNTLGTLREWGSSDGNFFVTYTAIPQSDLNVNQVPDLIPPQMQKYLRYYVLSMCFGRTGEGYRPDLAKHWHDRYDRGVQLFMKLSDVAFQDRIYVREEVGITEMRRVPLVQLPPQFERIWTWLLMALGGVWQSIS